MEILQNSVIMLTSLGTMAILWFTLFGKIWNMSLNNSKSEIDILSSAAGLLKADPIYKGFIEDLAKELVTFASFRRPIPNCKLGPLMELLIFVVFPQSMRSFFCGFFRTEAALGSHQLPPPMRLGAGSFTPHLGWK